MDKNYRYTKICKCCGKEFQTNSPQKLYCDREHWLPCPVCGKLVMKKDKDFTVPPRCCSKNCSSKLTLSKIHSKKCAICGEEFKPSSGIATICNKDHYVKCEICGKDFLLTKKKFHDNVTTCSRKCSLEKSRRFYMSKYGVDHPMKNPDVRKRQQKSMVNKYGFAHALQVEVFKEAAEKTNLNNFGTPFACLSENCIKSNMQGAVSRTNVKFAEILALHNIQTELEFRLDKYSYDMKLVGQNKLIEIDPTYTHNVLGNHWDLTGLDPYYHYNKTRAAVANNHECLHIFDWDDVTKLVYSLLPVTHVSVDKCQIYKLHKSVAKQFLNTYCWNNSAHRQLLCLGLVYEGELLEVMTLGKPTYGKKYNAELLRMCIKPGFAIDNGYNKMLEWAIETYQLDSIVAHCDLAKEAESSYIALGMNPVRRVEPRLIWSKGKEMMYDNSVKHRKEYWRTDYKASLINDKWLPICDCGQTVFELNSHM